jgi:DNA-binding NtrC family response regulator
MPLSILLVDDDEQVRRTVARMLRLDGHQVTEAGSGAEALAALDERAADLVLSDVMMPDMNGCDLGRLIARRYPDQRLLWYSGHVFTSLFSSGICPEDLPFMQKPFGVELLRQRIAECLAAPAYRFR